MMHQQVKTPLIGGRYEHFIYKEGDDESMDSEHGENEPEYEIEVFDKSLHQEIRKLRASGMDAKSAKMKVIDADREKGNQIAYR